MSAESEDALRVFCFTCKSCPGTCLYVDTKSNDNQMGSGG